MKLSGVFVVVYLHYYLKAYQVWPCNAAFTLLATKNGLLSLSLMGGPSREHISVRGLTGDMRDTGILQERTLFDGQTNHNQKFSHVALPLLEDFIICRNQENRYSSFYFLFACFSLMPLVFTIKGRLIESSSHSSTSLTCHHLIYLYCPYNERNLMSFA